MGILNGLYLIFIQPIEFWMDCLLEWGFALTHSWGWALLFLSLVVNTAILPIYNKAEGWQEEERELKRAMARQEDMIRRTFRGQKRFALLSVLRRQHGYGSLLTMRASVGLLLQIPFFFAAYHLLSHYEPLAGQAWGPFADLSAPDALLSLAGLEINVLPFIMTAVNLFSAFVYTKNLTQRDKVRIYGIALLFLVLLYNAPAALTLYWTLNNLYSFGKNIVEKDWMQRSAWRVFWANRQAYSPKRFTQGCVAGTFGYHWKGLLTALRHAFGIGTVFWLYTCTLVFVQHGGSHDSGFRAAIWHFGGQCVLTMLLASLVLGLAGFLSPRRKWVGQPLFLVASVALLFFCQFAVFKFDLEVKQGYFLADLWDSTGWTCFAVWALGILAIVKYQNRLVGFLTTIRNALVTRLSFISSIGEKENEETSPIPSARDTVILACLMGMVCGLFLWYFVPFCTYFRNANEFEFNGWELFWKLAPWCFITVLAASLLFFASTYFLSSECVRLPWKRKGKYGAKITVVYTVVIFILFAFLLEGTVLSYNLPEVAGEYDIFTEKYHLVIDAVIWISLVLVGIFGLKRISRNFFTFFFILVIFSTTAFCDFLLEKDEKIVDIQKINSNKDLSIVSDEELFSLIEFSKKSNTIIILVDSLDSLSFEKSLEVYPKIKQTLEGFWFFKENLGPGGLTRYAVPQILSGEIYDKEGPGVEYALVAFTQNALVGTNNMATDASKYGAKVFIHTGGLCAMTRKDNKSDEVMHGKSIEIKSYISMLTFKFFPYFTKHVFIEMVNLKNHVIDSRGIIGDDLNKYEFKRLIARMRNTCDDDVLLYIHFFGVHLPFIKGDILETTNEFFNDFAVFIDEMKYHNLYDKSTIIVMADHGLYSKDYRDWYPDRQGTQPTALFPLLMIKTPESRGEMLVREDLTSSIYIRYLLQDFYKKGATNAVMQDFLAGLPKSRFVYKPAEGKYEAIGTFSTMELKKVVNDK